MGAEADAYYGSLAATWPATFGYGVQSTCYGCRGHFIGKRSVGYAAPIYGYGHGIAHHGGHATSFGARSPQGLHGHFGYGKREAEAEPEADAYYGYGYGHGFGHGYGHRLGYHGLGYSHGGYYGHGYGHGYGYGYHG